MHEQVRAHASPDPDVQQRRVEDFAEHEMIDQVEDFQPVDLVLQCQLHFAAADGDGGARGPELAVQEADAREDAVGGQGCGCELAGQDGEVGEAESFVEAGGERGVVDLPVEGNALGGGEMDEVARLDDCIAAACLG